MVGNARLVDVVSAHVWAPYGGMADILCLLLLIADELTN